MESTNQDLNKETLKKIVFCAFIMSGIDGYIDEDEVDVIREFAEQNWKDDYGSVDDLFMEIDKEVVDFFVPTEGKFNLEESFLLNILDELSPDNENLLLDLMIRVMEADGVIETNEVKLIKIINKHIKNRTE